MSWEAGTDSACIAEQVDFFMENGYIVIKQAFTMEKAAEHTKNMWVRLGRDPNDKSTWDQERIHMPVHHRERVADFAPKVRHELMYSTA